MKTNMIKTVRKLSLSFSLLIISIGVHNAQVLEKVYTSEIDISKNAKIFVNGPKNFDIEGHGTLSISSEDQKYVIKGKDWKPIVKIDQDFKINTWDESKVKQLIQLKVETVNPNQGQELLKKLQLTLEENAAGIVNINCNLGMEKIEIVNGFFRKDRTTLSLKDGSSYDIKKLEVSATLFIPKTNDLELDLRFISTTLGEHTGKVKARLNNAGFNSESVNELDLKIAFSTVRLQEINQLKLDSESSQLSIKNIDKLQATSSFSKYILGSVDQLILEKSSSDNFSIKEVKDIRSTASTFSDFRITNLFKNLDIKANSGDIVVDYIKQGFEKIQLNNSFSTISLGVEETTDYTIEVFNNPFTSYDYPKGLIETKKEDDTGAYLLKGNKSKAGIIQIRCESCKVLFDY